MERNIDIDHQAIRWYVELKVDRKLTRRDEFESWLRADPAHREAFQSLEEGVPKMILTLVNARAIPRPRHPKLVTLQQNKLVLLCYFYIVTSALWSALIIIMWVRGFATWTALIATATGVVLWVLGFWKLRRFSRSRINSK